MTRVRHVSGMSFIKYAQNQKIILSVLFISIFCIYTYMHKITSAGSQLDSRPNSLLLFNHTFYWHATRHHNIHKQQTKLSTNHVTLNLTHNTTKSTSILSPVWPLCNILVVSTQDIHNIFLLTQDKTSRVGHYDMRKPVI